MKWFSGSVEEAIREKSSKQALLLVHVTDDGADSASMTSIWESTEITEVPIVALRLLSGTQSFQQFTQFYPVIVIPSAYFIGLDGKVIEAVVGKKEEAVMSEFVTRAVDAFKGVASGQSDSSSSPQQQNVAVSDASSSSSTIATPASTQQPAAVETAQPSSSSTAPSIEERLQRTRETVEKRENERERDDEVRRRRHGQEMAKMREDYERKQREADAEERRKQKDADKIYMEKLRKQIEEDRAEKAVRFSAERQRQKEIEDEKARVKAAAAAEQAAKEQAARASIARVQFRLPNGSSVAKQFAPEDKLRVAYDFAKTLLPSTRQTISLSTITPRYTFTADDMEKTLAELTIAPSAVLLVLRSDGKGGSPGQASAANALFDGSNFFSAMFNSLYKWFAMVWTFIAGFIWAQPAVTDANGSAASQSQQASSGTAQTQRQGQRPTSSSSSASSSGTSTGKVYRLHDLKRDDDADKATWNGNSTNQM